jgi:hypothetical protein
MAAPLIAAPAAGTNLRAASRCSSRTMLDVGRPGESS